MIHSHEYFLVVRGGLFEEFVAYLENLAGVEVLGGWPGTLAARVRVRTSATPERTRDRVVASSGGRFNPSIVE